MKAHRFVARAFALLAFASLVSVAAASTASAASPAVILIVNTEQIFSQAKVGVSVRDQIQDMARKLQAEDKKAQDAIEAEAKKLTEQRALLSPEDFKKKIEALQKKDEIHQRMMSRKGQELKLAADNARREIEAAIRPIFQAIMDKNGATILLDQSVVLAGGVDLDVTAEVLKQLDAKLTTVTVKPVSLDEAKKSAQ